ncbi:hypothetical protein DOTSEDRAFT_37014 [Dothistroma septosporum NZE10]|uniref:Uncharacterized protein n=1 Tax=Dothistroma septosporum (strain NZE10 / CBS 128990) TaxID=675120 RepID=N1PHR7_DOTSN|nr:hypothetical protein DOTSEDRAFT_37014 [Dothistroma septosporum NZE10]
MSESRWTAPGRQPLKLALPTFCARRRTTNTHTAGASPNSPREAHAESAKAVRHMESQLRLASPHVSIGLQRAPYSLLPAEGALTYTHIPSPDVCALDFPTVFTNTSLWTSKGEFFISGAVADIMRNSGTMRANDVAVAPVTGSTNAHTRYLTREVPNIKVGFFCVGASPSENNAQELAAASLKPSMTRVRLNQHRIGLHNGSATHGYT